MARIGFIGLGNMGLPMAKNLLKAGHEVTGFDLSAAALEALQEAGGKAAEGARHAVIEAEAVVTALPAARHLKAVYLGGDGILAVAQPGTLFIDCSTVDVASARTVAMEAESRGQRFVDSPMSGGVGGATAGTLSFMVGGSEPAFEAARPILGAMGRNIFHAGAAGAGAAAKICNNLMLAIQMIAVAEGFNLAEKLGLEAQKLYDISSTATARCWSLNDYCPAPGPVPNAPSNRDYAPGFAAALMLKDLRIAMETAQAEGVSSPLGAQATQLYALMDLAGQGEKDFSGIIRLLRGEL
ncbi:3-hydroxyisobutyrate dehydrogenase [Paralimibaculum aggregatum]|uniref:3-hydroxyisobutyrate dehydrogenase n=1 Tax=Paralimibaculum aggregatum TaxID=3036245 RepID=A0ABQ6LHF9_9RHOB|nr:3-hydroxyisobutyrate dehydrogenase [Limibaculum sp. NKW23]GMG82725.1 3-hydroxyisobutyrate dehydrogenase [Limibaculum sp. NKW23]